MTGAIARVRRLFTPRPSLAAPRLLDRFAGPLDEVSRVLFEHPSAGRAVVDADGRIVRASARLQRMVGTALRLLRGTPVGELFAEADREAALAEIAAVLSGANGASLPRQLTLQMVSEAAEPLTVSLTCSALSSFGRAAEGVLLSVHDVSLLTRLQAQLAQSQRLQAAGQLAAGVAHDFNNLLTAIIGGADALAGRGGLDDEAEEDVAAIRASAGRGAALVRHLLAFGRQQTFQPRVLVLDSAVSDLAGVLRRMLGSRVQLELALERLGRQVRVDPTALDQVLVNLAVNARDAMPDGGTLTVRTGKLTLHRPLPRGPESIPPGNYVMVEVEDTGSGIPPDVLPHIFEPFFTTRRGAGGTGLGLSTVHGIVRQCDGFLGVESFAGQGTRMRVYLPAWHGEAVGAATPETERAEVPRAPVPPAQARLPLLVAGARRGAVLLVDDEDVVRRVAERALLRQGWTVFTAGSAEAALEQLEGMACEKLTAVVSDLVMPGMDGAELVCALRERLGNPHLPAILVSGYAAEELREKIAALPGPGSTRFLAKPYEIKELAAALTDVTAKRRVNG